MAVTGLTGKKSGGGIAQILSTHKDVILAKFPGGVRALVRSTSNTTKLDESPLHFEKMCGELKDIVFLEQAFKGADTILHMVGIGFS